MPTRFLINQCQIITFLILKYDIIENSRIELRGKVLPVQVGGLLGGGGGGRSKGMLPPPPHPPPPLFLCLWYSLRSFVVFSSEGKSNFHVCKHLVQFTNFQRTNTQEWLKFCQFDKISIWNCVFVYRHTSLSAIRDRAWYNVNEKQNTCSY